MKISMFKFYKTSVISFIALATILIIASLAYTAFYTDGEMDECIMMYISIPIGFAISLFPILINYRQLTHVSLDHDKCISYSLLGKKLCQINYNEYVFYSFFDVRFAYAPPVRFIALSNLPFVCNQNPKSIFEKKFYGAYDQKQIIIFPYDDQVAPLLNLDNWQKTQDNQGTVL